MMPLGLRRYDFLDFGASKGGCIDFAKKRLGGVRGLGIDINPERVANMRAHGYDCIEGDVTDLAMKDNAVRFVTMSHVLEHLSDLSMVERTVGSAARVAREFLFIQGPWFDADEYLAERGLKFYWSDWHGHKCHVDTADLRQVFRNVGIDDYVLMARAPVEDSSDSSIHPLESRRNQHDYDPGEHPPKPQLAFNVPIFREMVCLVRLPKFGRRRFWQRAPLPSWDDLLKARAGCQPFVPPPATEPNAALKV